MSEGYSSKTFTCPYYLGNEKGCVMCQGGEVSFLNANCQKSYVHNFCSSIKGWEKCSFAQCLIKEFKRKDESMEEMTLAKAKKALKALVEFDELPSYAALETAIEALDFQQAAQSNNQYFGWLTTKTKLPEDMEQNRGKSTIYCMVSFEDFPNQPAHVEIRQRRKVKDKWEWSGKDTEHITHWRPRPNAVRK